MYCEHCHPNIQPDDYNKIDSTRLCNNCQYEFYEYHYKKIANPYYRGDYFNSVWKKRIEELLFGVDDKTQLEIFLEIYGSLWQRNFNERSIDFVRFIIGSVKYIKLINISENVKDIRIKSLINSYILDENFKAAENAIKHTHDALPFIGNWFGPLLDGNPRAEKMFWDPDKSFLWVKWNRDDTDEKAYKLIEEGKITNKFELIRYQAASSKKLQIGNCGENSLIALLYIYDNYPQARPIDIVAYNDHPWHEHAFVVIGGGEYDNFFHPNMIICDAYHDEIYKYDESKPYMFKKKQKSNKDEYKSKCRVNQKNFIEDLKDDGGNILR